MDRKRVLIICRTDDVIILEGGVMVHGEDIALAAEDIPVVTVDELVDMVAMDDLDAGIIMLEGDIDLDGEKEQIRL